MKKLTTLFILLVAALAANAQTSGGASQTTTLNMSDAIDISIVTAGTINMPFNTVNDYANGVESDNHTLLVRSNKKFNVRVKALTSRFTYAGTGTDPKMSSNVLAVKVVSNNTGGTIGSGYSNYKALSTSGGKIINNATPGGNNTFSVKFQAKPGFTFPAGSYTVDVVYTATQA